MPTVPPTRAAASTLGETSAVSAFTGDKLVTDGETGIVITDDGPSLDCMLSVAPNRRTVTQQATGAYQAHLAPAVWASVPLGRLDKLNALRVRNDETRAQVLGDDSAVTAISTLPSAWRGGYCEFVPRDASKRASGWPVGAFAWAVRAEGVPLVVDRHTRQEGHAALLHAAHSCASAPTRGGLRRGRAPLQRAAPSGVCRRVGGLLRFSDSCAP